MGPPMRLALRLLVALTLALAGTVGARASYEGSREWFSALSFDQRTEIQGDLILLGYYDYLVDGAFGQGTYTAVTGFERSFRSDASGVLSEGDVTRLKTDAEAVRTRLGLAKIEDGAGQISIVLPAALLTETETKDNGTIYRSEDGGLTLTTVRKPIAEQVFRRSLRGPVERNLGPRRLVLQHQ